MSDEEADPHVDLERTTFTPRSEDLFARLPQRLPEDIRQRESEAGSLAKFRTRGYPCPRCHSTNTKFFGNRKCTRNPPPGELLGPRGLNFQVPVWECLTATLRGEERDPKIPCLDCPVCLPEQDLQESLRHFCPGNNLVDTLVPAGEKCRLCDYESRVHCACPECAQIPHAKTFQIIFTWAPVSDHAKSQKLSAAGLTKRDCTDVVHYQTLHSEYTKEVKDKEAEQRRREYSFAGLPNAVSSALSNIFSVDQGPKLFSEMQAANPSALTNLGAPAALLARLPPPASSPVAGSTFTPHITFAAPNKSLAKTLVRADQRTGGLLSSSPTTLLTGGFGPARQSTEDHRAVLQSSSDESLRAQLRAAGFPDDCIEDEVHIAGSVESYVVPIEREISRPRLGSSSWESRPSSSWESRPSSSQSTIGGLTIGSVPDAGRPAAPNDIVVGNFIRCVREANLEELKTHIHDENALEYRDVYRKNKRSFDLLTVLNGEDSDKRRRIFHSAMIHQDCVQNPNTGHTEKDLELINFFIAAANQTHSESGKLDSVRSGPKADDDWDD